MSCPHYERGCHLLADCCGDWFPCRVCHDDEHEHKMDRHAVKRVRCRKCRFEQQPQQTCGKCKHTLGQYFCRVCNLFDHKGSEKGIFHCDQCGICRVGGKDNFYHCGTCAGCYPTHSQSTHKCVNNVMLQECCICLEDMFNSRESPSILRCGHILHNACLKKMAQFALTKLECPLCRGSLWSDEPDDSGHDEDEGGDEVDSDMGELTAADMDELDEDDESDEDASMDDENENDEGSRNESERPGGSV